MATGVSPSAVTGCGNELVEERPQEQLPNRLSRATRQARLVGYDCEFVKPPSVDFPQTDCPVCLLVLREPHQASCCGNSYCEACIKCVQRDNKCCPTCNEADFTIFPDKRLKRSLYALSVYCSQRREGCDWEGELGELDRHLNLQPSPEQLLVGCQVAEIDCTYCLQPFQRRYIQPHQSDDCNKRPYTCQYCNTYATTFEDVTQNHWPMCPLFSLSCPNNCELVLQRQELEHHVSQDCPLTLLQCDFHMVGCQVQLTKKDMASHTKENLAGHLSLLTTKLLETSRELHETRDELRESKDKVAHLEAELTKTLASEEQLQATITECRDQNRRLERSLAEQEKKHLESEAKLMTLEKVMCTGTLPVEFKMTGFNQKKRRNKTWFSPPFYTHTHGYRMCIRVDANGIGSGEGTRVSVFIYMMCGPFDADLKWPFRGYITIQAINQAGGMNHEMTINYTVDTSYASACRVRSGERGDNGWGIHEFLSHSSLHYNAALNTQYLKENSLRFCISEVKIES